MRTITYKCDRCGKVIVARAATKLNINIQKGDNPLEKKSLDFCSPCFLFVKNTVTKLLAAEKQTDSADEQKDVPDLMTPKQSDEPAVLQMPNPDKLIAASKEETEGDYTLISGPITSKEKQEILRLYIEEGFSAEQIAKTLHRASRGISRAINFSAKSGELDKLRKEFADKQEADDTESNIGSGASNSGIVKDTYTAPPQRKTIGGVVYDIGCILALANAGWQSSKIAEEKHYDEAVVRVIMENYG